MTLLVAECIASERGIILRSEMWTSTSSREPRRGKSWQYALSIFPPHLFSAYFRAWWNASDKSSNHQIATSAPNHFPDPFRPFPHSVAISCHGGHDDCICSSVDPTRSTGCQEPCGGAGQHRKTRSASDGIGFQTRSCESWQIDLGVSMVMGVPPVMDGFC